MNFQTIATNLRRLRRERQLSQEELAARADLSRSGYRKIEAGASLPRSSTLAALAEALAVPVAKLVTPVSLLHNVRFRSFEPLRTREGILADVGRWLADYNQLEELLGDRAANRLAEIAVPRRPEEGASDRPAVAARRVRALFGLGAGEPVRDICGLLESHGIKLLTVDIASPAFFGLSVAATDGGPAVVVNCWDRISVERRIFTAAHELGHLVLHLNDYDIDAADELRHHEEEANRFAGEFLMPDDVFWREWEEAQGLPFVDRVLKIKRMFRVSYRTVLYRLHLQGRSHRKVFLLFQSAYKRRTGRLIMRQDEPSALEADAFRASFPAARRAGEPENLSQADFMIDRLAGLVRRGIEQEVISLSRGAEILGIGLSEMRERSADWAD